MKKNNLVIIFLCSLLNCSAQWTHHNPGTTDFLSDVDFISETVGFAEDWDNGMLWGTTDGGLNWSMLLNNTPVYFMNFISADTGFTSSQPALYRTTDGGHFWDPVISDPDVFWWSRPFFLDHNLGYTIQSSHQPGALMDSLITYVTHNGGTSWTVVSTFPDSISSQEVDDVFFYDSLLGFFVSGPRMYKTTDGGSHWNLMLADDNDYYWTCFFTSPDTGFIGTIYSSDILRTVNGGVSWQVMIIPTATPVYAIKFITNKIGYACGGDGFSSGFIIKTIDGGQVWTLDYGDNFTYNALSFPSGNVGYACGLGGSVVRNTLLDGISDQPVISCAYTFFNPSNDILSVNNLSFAASKIEIYNILGARILQRAVSSWRKNIELDLSEAAKGIYVVCVTGGENTWRGKVVKE